MQTNFAKNIIIKKFKLFITLSALLWVSVLLFVVLGLPSSKEEVNLTPDLLAELYKTQKTQWTQAVGVLVVWSLMQWLALGGALWFWSKAALKVHDVTIKDDLTGALMYQPFMDEAERQCRLASRSGRSLSIIAFEIGNLVQINKDMGRDSGDKLLRAAGIALEKTLRESDTLGRLSGLRFAIVLPGTDPQQMQGAYVRIRDALRDIRHSSPKGELSLRVRLASFSQQEPRGAAALVHEVAMYLDESSYED